MVRLATLTLVLLVAPAAAEPSLSPPPPRNDLGADAVVVLPLGAWRDEAGVGFGAGVRVRVPLSADLTITARLAGIGHLARERAGTETTVVMFPLLGGARYHVSDPGRVRGFFHGEVGVVVRRTDVAIAGLHDSDTDLVFGSALGGGVSLGRFEVTASAWLSDLAALDDAVGVMLTAGGVIWAL